MRLLTVTEPPAAGIGMASTATVATKFAVHVVVDVGFVIVIDAFVDVEQPDQLPKR
jgi:hypothetical protein